MGEIRSHEDLLTNQGQELYELPRNELPLPVQRWQAAFGLCLWLGNGWADIAWQHLGDLAQGVEGLAECGFEVGAAGGREVFQVFRDHGIDLASPEFEQELEELPEEASQDIEAAVNAIDERGISTIWDSFDLLHDLLISRAEQLVRSGE